MAYLVGAILAMAVCGLATIVGFSGSQLSSRGAAALRELASLHSTVDEGSFHLRRDPAPE